MRRFGIMRKDTLTSGFAIAVVISMAAVGPFGIPARSYAFIDGSNADCTDFRLGDLFTLKAKLYSLGIAEALDLLDIDITDEGWVWVDPDTPFQSVSGVAENSHVASNDLTANHNSHDQNTIIKVDPQYLNLISDANGEEEEGGGFSKDTIEMEWENGIDPDTLTGDGNAYFPKWAWPSAGDRVWTNGHWVFDCGHATVLNDEGEPVPFGDPECYVEVPFGNQGETIFVPLDKCSHYRSEIHPARAIASMRDQMFTLPETGTTPIRGVATDLFIHGQSGYMVSQLNCGMDIIFSDEPDGCDIQSTPIDANYTFDIILPSKPFPSAILATFVEDGPDNTLDVAPVLHPFPDSNPPKVNVTIPLADSGATPDDVYARKIYAGWVAPPENLKHHSLSLDLMDLHEDQDLDPGNCECTFFWLNVDKSPDNEWIRLADFTTGMDSYDDDGGFGDGEKHFTDADFDYYVSGDMAINFRANGYDQDCMDKYFGHHHFTQARYVDCYIDFRDFTNYGNDDPFHRANATLLAEDYQCRPGSNTLPAQLGEDYTLCTNTNGNIHLTIGEMTFELDSNNQPIIVPDHEYELFFTLDEVPLTDEDTADLSVTKTCAPGTGQSFNCTITVTNDGPGLPRNVVVHDKISTDAASGSFTQSTPTFTVENSYTTSPVDCTVTSPVDFECDIGTVPVDGKAVITFTVTASQPGTFDDTATVTTDSTDPNSNNNEAKFKVIVVDIDIKPGEEKNTISINNDKSVRVAILGSATVDVTKIDVFPLSTDAPKFGGSSPKAPASTSLEDVNKDGKKDLVLKYNEGPKNPLGFKSGDIQGCLTGKLTDGTPILGCDPVRLIK